MSTPRPGDVYTLRPKLLQVEGDNDNILIPGLCPARVISHWSSFEQSLMHSLEKHLNEYDKEN